MKDIVITLDPLGALALYKIMAEFRDAAKEKIVKSFAQEILDQIKGQINELAKEEKENAA